MTLTLIFDLTGLHVTPCFTLTMPQFVAGACPHAFQLMGPLDITDRHMNVHAVEELYEAINMKYQTEMMRANLGLSSMEHTIGNTTKGNMSRYTATAKTAENIIQNCHIGVPNEDCGQGRLEKTSYPDNMPLDERLNQGSTGDNSAPDATRSCPTMGFSTRDNSALDVLMSGHMRGSWCQDIIAEWYRTVDLDYRASLVKDTYTMATYSHIPIAVINTTAYLDVLLMRLGKTELVIELIKKGKLKLRRPEAKDFILNNTYITPCLKEKECLQILLKSCKNKKVKKYCGTVCLINYYTGHFYLRPSLLYFVRHIHEKELFTLILKIFMRVLPTRRERSKQYECLKLLSLCIENERLTSVQEVMHHLLKFKNSTEQMQVAYGAVKQLVRSNRPDILQSLMEFRSFPLEDVLLYCVLCGKLQSI